MKELDIELCCRSADVSSSYGSGVTVNLNGVSDMGGNPKEVYVELLKRFIETDDVVDAFEPYELIKEYGFDTVLENVPTDDLMDWVVSNVDQKTIFEWIGEDNMVAYAKQYIRENKIAGLI